MRPTRTTLCLLATAIAGVTAFPPHAAFADAIATTDTQPQTGEDIRKARARERLERKQAEEDARERADRPDGPAVANDAPPLDPELLETFTRHVQTLAAEDMGGRLPGTPGGERAAAYIETQLATLGLRPAFTDDDANPTFRQPVPIEPGYEPGEVAFASDALDSAERGEDYDLLPLSGSGEAEGTLVFASYSIPAGEDGYLTYGPTTDLTGKIALILRYEPFDGRGRSWWAADGWSYASVLAAKVAAAERRGAAGVIVVTPPGVRGERRDTLKTDDRGPTDVGFEIPVITVTRAVADKLIRAGDRDGRTLEDLTTLANESGVIVDMPGVRARVGVELSRPDRTAPNIGAILPGRGSLANEYVVIGAHYDHIGMGHFASRTPDHAGEIHPGADDNASGTSAVLLAADMLSDAYAEPDAPADARTILFLLFTAEESGLVGSTHYVSRPIAPLSRHAAMLNMDMVGRLGEHGLEIGGMASSDALIALARPRLDASGIAYFEDGSIGTGRSDHAPFDRADVPNLFFFTGLHDDYHTYRDTIDKVNLEGGARIARTVAHIALDAALEPRPFREGVAEPDPVGPRVRVGIVPQDSAGGVRLARVFDDTSASAAGLRPGDRIVSWNGEPTPDTDALNACILRHEPGEVITLGVIREGASDDAEPEELEMTLRGFE